MDWSTVISILLGVLGFLCLLEVGWWYWRKKRDQHLLERRVLELSSIRKGQISGGGRRPPIKISSVPPSTLGPATTPSQSSEGQHPHVLQENPESDGTP